MPLYHVLYIQLKLYFDPVVFSISGQVLKEVSLKTCSRTTVYFIPCVIYFTRELLNVAEIRFGVYFYTKSNCTGAISGSSKTLGRIQFSGQERREDDMYSEFQYTI